MNGYFARWVFAIVGVICFATLAPAQSTPKPQPTATPSALCNRENGIAIIGQQIEISRTLDEAPRRVGLLVKAADLLWTIDQQKARATFTEAMDLAIRDFREHGDTTIQMGRLPVEQPDQRFVVITAIAKRDRAWANKLAEEVFQEQIKEAENKQSNAPSGAKMAEKLFNIAFALLPSDPQGAFTFARASLRYTASLQLPLFLYRLSEVDRALSDQLYQEALRSYAETPMEEFLYLSSYPFANSREAGEMPAYTNYKLPEGQALNPTLARLFVQVLLRRAQQIVSTPPTAPTKSQYAEAAQMWIALSRLEPQIQSALPDLSPAVLQVKGSLYPLLIENDQQRATESLIVPARKSFDERIEDALKLSDPDRRDGNIALAIITGSDGESLDHVVAAADKIAENDLRAQVLSRFYFNRSRSALKEKSLAEARRLASKVEDLDQRAYLYSQIAAESIKQTKDDAQVREMLEEVITAAAKAPDTEIKARSLLGIAYLYSQIDPNRAVGVLGDAVKCINKIEAPDFSRDFVIKKIEGASFGFYDALWTPGFNPENAFRDVGKLDFEGTLYQAANFSNKPLRSLTTLAVIEPCLQEKPKAKRSKPKS